MPSLVGRRLTETHRLAQARLGADTVRLLVAAFPLLDPADIEGSFDRWLAVILPVVQAQRTKSSGLAAAYVTALRTLEIGPEPFVPTLAGAANEAAVKTSLLVTGPVSLRSNLRRSVSIERALGIAQAGSAAAGMRHALNGGRETVLASVNNDDRARGWQRVTSGNACSFCSLLAGRGHVYSEASADFASHDHCHCGAEPVYGEARGVREFTPSERLVTDEQRAVRNERVRAFIADNGL